MLTETDIEEFYEHFKALRLKRPVAAVTKATGFNKGNVSQYLSRKLPPSEAFLAAYYKAFPKSIKKVLSEPVIEDPEVQYGTGPTPTMQLLETINRLVKQNDTLAETNRILSAKIATIPVDDQSETQRSVDAMLQGLREFVLKLSTGTRYKSIEEARAAYRKELGGVLEKTQARGIRDGSDKQSKRS